MSRTTFLNYLEPIMHWTLNYQKINHQKFHWNALNCTALHCTSKYCTIEVIKCTSMQCSAENWNGGLLIFWKSIVQGMIGSNQLSNVIELTRFGHTGQTKFYGVTQNRPNSCPGESQPYVVARADGKALCMWPEQSQCSVYFRPHVSQADYPVWEQ